MNNQNGEKFTFVKKEKVGKCPKCNKDVFTDNLYVRDNDEVFHLSCRNEKDAE